MNKRIPRRALYVLLGRAPRTTREFLNLGNNPSKGKRYVPIELALSLGFTQYQIDNAVKVVHTASVDDILKCPKCKTGICADHKDVYLALGEKKRKLVEEAKYAA